jgi:hypothetical protein
MKREQRFYGKERERERERDVNEKHIIHIGKGFFSPIYNMMKHVFQRDRASVVCSWMCA